MPVVFGYGSLINRSSAEKTLGRSICRTQMACATLPDHIRSWTARDCVKLQIENRLQACDALFLDLSHRPGQQCNGIMLEVCQRELQQLDIREKGYERHEVELICSEGKPIHAYTYIIPDADKFEHGIILARYRQMIDDALQEYPAGFADAFWKATAPSATPIVDGEYIFENCAQNAAAGRVLS